MFKNDQWKCSYNLLKICPPAVQGAKYFIVVTERRIFKNKKDFSKLHIRSATTENRHRKCKPSSLDNLKTMQHTDLETTHYVHAKYQRDKRNH